MAAGPASGIGNVDTGSKAAADPTQAKCGLVRDAKRHEIGLTHQGAVKHAPKEDAAGIVNRPSRQLSLTIMKVTAANIASFSGD